MTVTEQLSATILQLMIKVWLLAWAVSMGHWTRKLPESIDISIWRPYFKMADTTVQQLSNIIVYLIIQAWQLTWAVSVGHLTRKLSEAIEIYIRRPNFMMADTLKYFFENTSLRLLKYLFCLRNSWLLSVLNYYRMESQILCSDWRMWKRR